LTHHDYIKLCWSTEAPLVFVVHHFHARATYQCIGQVQETVSLRNQRLAVVTKVTTNNGLY